LPAALIGSRQGLRPSPQCWPNGSPWEDDPPTDTARQIRTTMQRS